MTEEVGGDVPLERVWRVVGEIPRGRVSTYGRVARRAGLPRRARFVGYALRCAPADLLLPWHRVINAQGRSSFAQGSDRYRTQLALLREEGVRLVAGRVDLGRYGWPPAQTDLDRLLWRPDGNAAE